MYLAHGNLAILSDCAAKNTKSTNNTKTGWDRVRKVGRRIFAWADGVGGQSSIFHGDSLVFLRFLVFFVFFFCNPFLFVLSVPLFVVQQGMG